jgi:aminodeoxyfutalosine deaminase
MATILRARYVFPVASDPIRDGFVCVEGQRIVACGAGDPPAAETVHDLGNVAILPGLVNAHAHLDFSDLPAPLGRRGIRMADWLRLVMQFRRRPSATPAQPATLGLDECLRNGVTTVGDIVQPGQQPVASPPNVTALLELIAPTAERVATAVELARQWCGRGGNIGLSPHAPYSVHPDLLAAAVELSRQDQLPVAMHLAESPEELELLQHGGGPLRGFLDELSAWDAATWNCPKRPLDYLRQLAGAHRALVVHGNYLDDEEIRFLAAHAERMSVVYCPRTHDWFANTTYPLEKMLAEGVAVALGTDGRGSSPDLSLFGEMRHAARRHPGMSLTKVLEMATLGGARALGRVAAIGSLAPGKLADLAIISLPDRSPADPHEWLFDPAAEIVACYCRGTACL